MIFSPGCLYQPRVKSTPNAPPTQILLRTPLDLLPSHYSSIPSSPPSSPSSPLSPPVPPLPLFERRPSEWLRRPGGSSGARRERRRPAVWVRQAGGRVRQPGGQAAAVRAGAAACRAGGRGGRPGELARTVAGRPAAPSSLLPIFFFEFVIHWI
uniref:Uncharacterized protein n=1 Tax=Oryza sativa subsp. japonica TaxID=39947 RepID=Q7F0Q3_ORYSJ|nr:hypothetical protein [Oryza sativa Japonica Group]